MDSKYSLPQDGGLILEGTPSDIIHRYEKIPTSIFEVESLGVEYVTQQIVDAIKAHEAESPNSLFALGLTTGRTPIGMYHELVRRYEAGEVSFKNVVVYSLDEFYPIKWTEQQSRSLRVKEDLLDKIDIKPENIHLIDGTTPLDEVSAYCAAYDRMARNLDLMVIGMGEQGQVGFNEAGSYAKSVTRMVQLSHQSRKKQAGNFYGIENTPRMAITMGMMSIMQAKKILMVANGKNKFDILKASIEGPVDPKVPASILQLHPDVTIIYSEV